MKVVCKRPGRGSNSRYSTRRYSSPFHLRSCFLVDQRKSSKCAPCVWLALDNGTKLDNTRSNVFYACNLCSFKIPWRPLSSSQRTFVLFWLRSTADPQKLSGLAMAQSLLPGPAITKPFKACSPLAGRSRVGEKSWASLEAILRVWLQLLHLLAKLASPFMETRLQKASFQAQSSLFIVFVVLQNKTLAEYSMEPLDHELVSVEICKLCRQHSVLAAAVQRKGKCSCNIPCGLLWYLSLTMAKTAVTWAKGMSLHLWYIHWDHQDSCLGTGQPQAIYKWYKLRIVQL